jgi:hypothetical protein
MTYDSHFERPKCPRRKTRLEICGSGHGLLTCREYKGNCKIIKKVIMSPRSLRTERDKTDSCCGMTGLIT